MSAMSASPPVGLPLSLIAEHKVVGSSKSVGGASVGSGPVGNGGPVVGAPVSGGGGVANGGMEPPPSPPHPTAADVPPPQPLPPQPPSAAAPVQQPPPAASPPVVNPIQGIPQSEGGPVAPGSGASTSGGSSELEANSVVGDVPPADAQPCVPSTPATVPASEQQPVPPPVVLGGHAPPVMAASPPVASPAVVPAPAVAEADPAPPPDMVEPPSAVVPPPPEDKPAAASVPQTPEVLAAPKGPSPSATPAQDPPAAAPAPTPVPVVSDKPSSQQEAVKPIRERPHKRKAQIDSESKKAAKVIESPVNDDGRKSKRMRLPTQPYQSPIPELNMIAKMNSTPKQPKQPEEKLIVFYRNEFLAVRNAEGGFYVCQTMQNIYRSSSKIKIRWFSQEANDTFTPDFYDTTEFDCILTNLNLDRIEKDKYKLPSVENQRTQSILKRAIDAEKGINQPADSSLTEEHPDGLDLSLYRHEDQLKKRKKSKGGKRGRSKASERKSARQSQSSEDESEDSDESIEEPKPKQAKITKIEKPAKGRGSKRSKAAAKKVKAVKKPAEVNNKKETGARQGTGAATGRRQADKTKSVVGAVAKTGGKSSSGGGGQSSTRPTRATRSNK